MKNIVVLGVGPGSIEYVLPITMKMASQCDILMGGKRNLDMFKHLNKQTFEINGDIQSAIGFIGENYKSKKIGILVSGDPGFFSMLHTLKRHFDGAVMDVFPGISSIQYLFSRIGIPWNNAVILSMHGREDKEFVNIVKDHPNVGIFTDKWHTPSLLCDILIRQGVSGKKVYVGENLSYPDERILFGSLEDIKNAEIGGMNVMVIVNE